MKLNWNKLNREQRIEAIKRGVSQKLSASKIAAELGCTKNSIIGMANRHSIKLATSQKREKEPTKPDWTKLGAEEKAQFVRGCFVAGLSVSAIVGMVRNASPKAIQRCAERNGISRVVVTQRPPREPVRRKYVPESKRPRKPGLVGIMELMSGQCRSPRWEEKPKWTLRTVDEWVFCGKPTQPGSSYCKECHERFWMKPDRLRYDRKKMNAGYR